MSDNLRTVSATNVASDFCRGDVFAWREDGKPMTGIVVAIHGSTVTVRDVQGGYFAGRDGGAR